MVTNLLYAYEHKDKVFGTKSVFLLLAMLK
jgi:hypothetical protein